MKQTRAPRLAIIIIWLVLSSTATADAVPLGPPLTTPQLGDIQTAALSLRQRADIRAAREQAVALFKNAPSATLADGLANLEAAIDELVFGVLLGSVANNPANPSIVWTANLPYSDGQRDLPGSRYADSPDRIYRSFPVKPGLSYTLHGRRNPLYPSLDYSIEAIPAPALWGKPTAALQARAIELSDDGSFIINIDSSTDNGRKNHLQLGPDTVAVLIRDTLADWSHQRPNSVHVSASNNDTINKQSKDIEPINNVASQILASARSTLGFLEQMVWQQPANELQTFERTVENGMPGGVFAIGRFSLKADEVLLITVAPQSADYISVQISDLWMRSASYDKRSTSLNNQQAVANSDGSISFIVSRQDPGYQNWLDTNNMNDGLVMVRWELLKQPADVANALRQIRQLPMSELDAFLSNTQAKLKPSQRRHQLEQRYKSYQFRLNENLH